MIDFHTHIFPPRFIEQREALLKAEPHLAEIYTSPTARMAHDTPAKAGIRIGLVPILCRDIHPTPDNRVRYSL